MKKFFILILGFIMVFFIFKACNANSTKEETLKDNNTKAFDQLMSKNSDDNYDYGEYKLITNNGNDEKALDITLEFKTNDIFRIGTVEAIRNLTVENFESKYGITTITLNIASEHPTDIIHYTYKNGKWDKPVQ